MTIDPCLLAVLEKAVEAGGENLTAKAIAGSTKADKDRLAELCAAGSLKKDKTKYHLTAAGRKIWEEHTPEKRRREIHENACAAFLSAVEKKDGKAFTTRELAKHSEETREQICRNGWCEAETKKNVFRLTALGSEFLLARLPWEEQAVRLRELQTQTQRLWSAARQKIEQDLESVEGAGSSSDSLCETLHTQLRTHEEEALEAMSVVSQQQQANGQVLELAKRLHERVTQTIEEAKQQIVRQMAAIQEHESQVQADVQTLIDEQKRRNHEIEKKVESRIAAWESQLARSGSSTDAHSSPGPSPAAGVGGVADSIAEEDVFQAACQAFAKLRQKNLRLGGVVKIPDLHDELLENGVQISGERLHRLLLKWRDEDWLALQVCNDVHLEPRANEGLATGQGVLLYIVRMNAPSPTATG